MSMEWQTDDGQVTVTNDVVATIAGGAAFECYGIVGMASINQIKDGIQEILKKDNIARGIVVRHDNDGLQIDMHIIVSYGTKISEIAQNVQSQVKYTLNQALGLQIGAVNIYIQGVRVEKE